MPEFPTEESTVEDVQDAFKGRAARVINSGIIRAFLNLPELNKAKSGDFIYTPITGIYQALATLVFY